MLSILSGILGFATSGLPSVLGFFQQKGDQKHEREMAKLQTERELELAKAGFISQEKIEAIKLDQIEVQTYAQEREALYDHDKKLVENASPTVKNWNAMASAVVVLLIFVSVSLVLYQPYLIRNGICFKHTVDFIGLNILKTYLVL